MPLCLPQGVFIGLNENIYANVNILSGIWYLAYGQIKLSFSSYFRINTYEMPIFTHDNWKIMKDLNLGSKGMGYKRTTWEWKKCNKGYVYIFNFSWNQDHPNANTIYLLSIMCHILIHYHVNPHNSCETVSIFIIFLTSSPNIFPLFEAQGT